MKHSLHASLLTLASLLASAPLAAAAAPRPLMLQGEALPAAREVIDRYVTATNLKTGIEKTSSLHIQGTFSMPAMGLTGATDIWSAKPNLRVASIEMGAFGKMLTGYDGKTAWMTHPMMGARILSDTEFLQAKLEAAYDSGLKAAENYESLKTVGRQTFEGKDCYKVEVVAKALAGMDAAKTLPARTSHEYYEVSSGLMLGSEGRTEGEMGGGPFTVLFSDYKDFGGQLLPTKTRHRQSGQEVMLEVGTVEFDTASEATFAPPLEIQKLVEAAAAKPKAAPKPQ